VLHQLRSRIIFVVVVAELTYIHAITNQTPPPPTSKKMCCPMLIRETLCYKYLIFPCSYTLHESLLGSKFWLQIAVIVSYQHLVTTD
jgi:hypothetical protein